MGSTEHEGYSLAHPGLRSPLVSPYSAGPWDGPMEPTLRTLHLEPPQPPAANLQPLHGPFPTVVFPPEPPVPRQSADV